MPKAVSKFRVTDNGVGEPPFALNDTVKLCILHLAKNVTLPVIAVVELILVPPVLAVYQPTKV